MKIELHCPCGAHATFEDKKGTYINLDGKPDEGGHIFVIQLSAAAWLKFHDMCSTFRGGKGRAA